MVKKFRNPRASEVLRMPSHPIFNVASSGGKNISNFHNMRQATKKKAQPVKAGLFGLAEFWLPDLDSNQGPAD
jgi:hypothetical protein